MSTSCHAAEASLPGGQHSSCRRAARPPAGRGRVNIGVTFERAQCDAASWRRRRPAADTETLTPRSPTSPHLWEHNLSGLATGSPPSGSPKLVQSQPGPGRRPAQRHANPWSLHPRRSGQGAAAGGPACPRRSRRSEWIWGARRAPATAQACRPRGPCRIAGEGRGAPCQAARRRRRHRCRRADGDGLLALQGRPAGEPHCVGMTDLHLAIAGTAC